MYTQDLGRTSTLSQVNHRIQQLTSSFDKKLGSAPNETRMEALSKRNEPSDSYMKTPLSRARMITEVARMSKLSAERESEAAKSPLKRLLKSSIMNKPTVQRELDYENGIKQHNDYKAESWDDFLALQKKLTQKSIHEANLTQQCRLAESKLATLKVQLEAEEKSKKLLSIRQAEEVKNLEDIRQRYIKKGEEEVELQKDLYKAQLKLKDVTGEIENDLETEKYLETVTEAAKKELETLQKELKRVQASNEDLKMQKKMEEKLSEDLRTEMRNKSNLQTCENNANQKEIKGLNDIIAEKESLIKELQSDVQKAESEIGVLQTSLEEFHIRTEHEKAELVIKLRAEQDNIDTLNETLNDQKQRHFTLSEEVIFLQGQEKIHQSALDEVNKAIEEYSRQINDTDQARLVLEDRLENRAAENNRVRKRKIEIMKDYEIVKDKLVEAQDKYRTVQMELNQERRKIDELKTEISRRTQAENDQAHALKTAKAYQEKLEQRLTTKRDEEKESKRQIDDVVSKIDYLRPKMDDLKTLEKDLKIKFEEKCQENNNLLEQLKTVESEFLFCTRESEIKMKDLKFKIDMTIKDGANLEEQIDDTEKQSEMIKVMMHQNNEEALEIKAGLEKQITTLEGTLAKLRNNISQKEEELATLEPNLKVEQDKCSDLMASNAAMEKEIALWKGNCKEQVHKMNVELATKRAEIAQTKDDIVEIQKELKLNTRLYESETAEIERTKTKVLQEEKIIKKLTKQIEEVKSLDDVAKSRMKSLTESLKSIESRLTMKTEEASKLRKQINDYNTEEEINEQLIKDEKETKLKLELAIKAESEAVIELEKELRAKETMFENDSLKVQSRIDELTAALEDRVKSSERLEKALESAKKANVIARERLFLVQEMQIEQNSVFNANMLRKQHDLKLLADGVKLKRVHEVTLRANLARKEDTLKDLEAANEDAEDQQKVQDHDLLLAKEEASIAQEKLDQRKNFETDLLKQIKDKDEIIAKLKAEVAKNESEEKHMLKECHNIEADVNVLKDRVKKKQEAVNELQKELQIAERDIIGVRRTKTKVTSLEEGMERAEKARSEYASMLLKTMDRDHIKTVDEINENSLEFHERMELNEEVIAAAAKPKESQ